MKSILKLIHLLFVSAIVVFMNSCATPYFVHDGTGDYYVSINSYGNYDLEGKTYYIESGDENISSNDLEFKEYAGYLEENLKIQGAQKTTDKKNADLCVLMNYCITDKSYQETIPIPEYGRTTIASSKTDGNTTTYQYHYGTIGYHYVQSNVSKFLRIVNIYAFDNKTLISEPIMVWKTNLKSEGYENDIRKVVPHIIFAAMNKLGKSTGEEMIVPVFKDGYKFNLWKKGMLSSPNYIQVSEDLLTKFVSFNPYPNNQSVNPTNYMWYQFMLDHVEKNGNETVISILKLGCILSYSIPQELYLCVNGRETKIGYVDNYTLGQTLRKECGDRHFVLHFPIDIKDAATIELKEYTNISHTTWKSWGTFDLTVKKDPEMM